MNDPTGLLLEALRSMFNDLFPVFGVALGVGIGIGVLHTIRKYLKATDLELAEAILEEARLLREARTEKPKNDHNLALLDEPEKPKNMFVRLGDDGELVEWRGDHETNSQV